jgi:hypothetical protein
MDTLTIFHVVVTEFFGSDPNGFTYVYPTGFPTYEEAENAIYSFGAALGVIGSDSTYTVVEYTANDLQREG